MIPNQCSPLGTNTKRGGVDHRMACTYKILQLSRHVPCCKGPILATDKYIYIYLYNPGYPREDRPPPIAILLMQKTTLYNTIYILLSYRYVRTPLIETYIYIYICISLSPNSLIVLIPLSEFSWMRSKLPWKSKGQVPFSPSWFSKKAFHPIVLQTNRLT